MVRRRGQLGKNRPKAQKIKAINISRVVASVFAAAITSHHLRIRREVLVLNQIKKI